MTLYTISVLIVGIGMITLLYSNPNNFIDEIKNFKDKFKEQLPVENPEVEKPKVNKKPSKRKAQAKKK